MNCQLEFSRCTRLEANVVTHQAGRQLRRHWIAEDARAPAPAIQSLVGEFERIPVDARCVERPAPLAIHSAHLEQVREVRVQLEHERRSEEHTSELQSQSNLVCRLLLEKKNTTSN